MKKHPHADSEKFMALPEAQRAKIIAEIDAEPPQRRLSRSRSLNAGDKKRWKRFQAKLGRPRVGRGTKAVSLTVEKGLLHEADAFARRNGMSRSELVARGLRAFIDRAA